MESITNDPSAIHDRPNSQPIIHRALSLGCALSFVLLVLACLPARAQVDTGSIVGTVQDSSGAIIPGATVTVVDEATGRTSSEQSGADGGYTFSPLRIGNYTLTVAKA